MIAIDLVAISQGSKAAAMLCISFVCYMQGLHMTAIALVACTYVNIYIDVYIYIYIYIDT